MGCQEERGGVIFKINGRVQNRSDLTKTFWYISHLEMLGTYIPYRGMLRTCPPSV